MIKAYSYSRFSSDRQKQGTSIERQQAEAVRWCEDNNIELSADTFEDKAVSAFSGANLNEGDLARFITRCDDGTVERGSYLIIENLDRLTRLGHYEASTLLGKLTRDKGIVVVTLKPAPARKYDHNSDFMTFLTALIDMNRSHEESVRKSDLGKTEWAKRYKTARETGKAVKMPLASWLVYESGIYKLVEEKAIAVRKIFRMCADGYGMNLIAKALEADGHKPFRHDKFEGKKWISASVYGIVKNKAAMGIYTPRDGGSEVEGYFPAAVDKNLFYQAQGAMDARVKAKSTKQSKVFNVWQGSAVCGLCGSAMRCLPKGRNSQRYLVCSGKIAGKCASAKNVRNDASEKVFKELLAKVGGEVLVNTNGVKIERELISLLAQIEQQRQQLSQVERDLATEYSPALMRVTRIKEAEIQRLTAQLDRHKSEQVSEQLNENDRERFFELLDLVTYDARQRANALLKRLDIKVAITGGLRPVFIASKGWRERKIWIPDDMQIDGQTHLVSKERDNFLQIILHDGTPVLVPLNDDQREKFKAQDKSGEDSDKLDDWLYDSLGIFRGKNQKLP